MALFSIVNSPLKKMPSVGAAHVLTLLVPGDFSTLMYRGGMFFHPPLKNDFLPQESIIFHPEIKFGIILEVF